MSEVPSEEIIAKLPARRGHFRLESGLHTDRWLTLDALFVDPDRAAAWADALAERLRHHSITAICGPLFGGAFLAQLIAQRLGVRFYYSQPAPSGNDGRLFGARYSLPAAQARQVSGERVVVVDDAVSAGSSVRATADSLAGAGASIAAVGTLLLLGDVAARHFGDLGVPIEALDRRPLALWRPDECPLCAAGEPLEASPV